MALVAKRLYSILILMTVTAAAAGLLLPGTFAAGAAAAAKTGTLVVTVADDRGQPVSGMDVSLLGADGNMLLDNVDYIRSNDSATGSFGFHNLQTAGVYTVVADNHSSRWLMNQRDGMQVRSKVKVGLGAVPTKATIPFNLLSSGVNPVKTGAFADRVVDEAGDPIAGASVRLSNGATEWNVWSGTDGTFTAYVPAGNYQMAIDSGDSELYKKPLYSVEVTAGQIDRLMLPLLGRLPWRDNIERQLGYSIATQKAHSLDELPPETKLISGTANRGATVTLLRLIPVGSGYLAARTGISATVPKSGAGTVGPFRLSLPSAMPGQMLLIEVRDEAGNMASAMTSRPLPKLKAPRVTPAAASAAVYDRDVALAVADPSRLLTTVTTTVYVNGRQLVPIEQFTMESGRLTIRKGNLALPRTGEIPDREDNRIELFHPGYETATVYQQVSPPRAKAPELTDMTVTKGAAPGTFRVAVSATPGNKLLYAVDGMTRAAVNLYDPVPAMPAAMRLTPGTDIAPSFMDSSPRSASVLNVYEVNADNRVVKAKSVVLSASQVKEVSYRRAALDPTKQQLKLLFDGPLSVAPTLSRSAVSIASYGNQAGQTEPTFQPLKSGDRVSVMRDGIVILFAEPLRAPVNIVKVAAGRQVRDSGGIPVSADIVTLPIDATAIPPAVDDKKPGASIVSSATAFAGGQYRVRSLTLQFDEPLGETTLSLTRTGQLVSQLWAGSSRYGSDLTAVANSPLVWGGTADKPTVTFPYPDDEDAVVTSAAPFVSVLLMPGAVQDAAGNAMDVYRLGAKAID